MHIHLLVYNQPEAAIPLVLQWDGISKCSARISTKSCMILYIKTVLAFASLCSRDSHFKLEIIYVTPPGSRSWKLFDANRAALRCAESSWDICFLLNRSHTALVYSMDGLTSVVYAAALTSFGHACILRLMKPMVRLALAVKSLMWNAHLRSLLMVTRYLLSFNVTSSTWLCSK